MEKEKEVNDKNMKQAVERSMQKKFIREGRKQRNPKDVRV